MTTLKFVFRQLMKEMFKRVGLEYDEEYCKKEGWYKTKAWTAEEQTSFQRWGEGLLRSKLKMTDYGAAKEMGWFLLSYGWTTRLVNEDKN